MTARRPLNDPSPGTPTHKGNPRRKEIPILASRRTGIDQSGTGLWRPPTRRAFVAMLSAAAATLAVRNRARLLPSDPAGPEDEDRPRSTWNGKTRWIGHC
jgi:hypothetical protein